MFQGDADVQRRGPSCLRSMNAERWEEKESPTRETDRRKPREDNSQENETS